MRSRLYHAYRIKDNHKCIGCKFCDAYFITQKEIHTQSEGVFCGNGSRCLNIYKSYQLQKIKKKAINIANKTYFEHLKKIKANLRTKQESAKRFKIKPEDYIRLTKSCVICGFNHMINLHHIMPKKDNGKDELDNYVGLCSNHHRLVHTKYNKLIKKDDGTFSIVSLKGSDSIILFCEYLWKNVSINFCKEKQFWIVCKQCKNYNTMLEKLESEKKLDIIIQEKDVFKEQDLNTKQENI